MVFKASCVPPPEVWAYPEPFQRSCVAEDELRCILSDYEEHHPHFVIVEYEGLFYIVEGKEMVNGFEEYEGE